MGTRRYGPNNPGPIDYDALADQAIARFRLLGRRMQIVVVVLLLISGIVAAVIYFRSQNLTTGSFEVATPNLLLGNPSGATSSFTNSDNYLMVKPYYVLSYNSDEGIPNWVSWEVTMDDLGSAPRKQVFDPDTTLPAGFNVVTTREYAGSGFQRGHMCPHSDRAANLEMSYATFVMTNIIPQPPNVNEKAWAQLESYCRRLVDRHQHLHIMSGPIGRGGRGTNGFRETLGRGNVVVPAECWKVVVVVPEEGGSDDLNKINAATRVVAVDMPNDNEVVGEEWAKYRTTPAHIELKTGLHFFTCLRPDIAEALRQRIDDEYIPPPRPMSHGGH